MKVSELAEELDIPTSAVLAQCQRFGIDASWAGAELSGSDVVILQAELGNADGPLDLTPADGPAEAVAEPPAPAVPEEPAAHTPPPEPAVPPPTSVASMPEAAGVPEPQPDPDPTTTGPGAIPPRPGAGTGASPDAAAATAARPLQPMVRVRRLDKAVRGSILALVLAVAALGAAEVLRNAWLIWALWILAGVSALLAIWNANRGRRHITTHPDRYKGLPIAVVVGVLSVAVAIVVGTSVYAAVRDAPAADAPLGDRDSVSAARWGWHRLDRVREEGWHRPAKDVDTCWEQSRKPERDVQRVEAGDEKVDCAFTHTSQVVRVFAVNRDLDAPYPGNEALQALAVERCQDLVDGLLDPEGDGAAVEGVLIGEVPTAAGWAKADHDVSCVIVTGPRKGRLR